jgi:phosphoribosylanthranilate isomerase
MIHTVTITGADDNVEQKELQKLFVKYPFVEWGILFSKTRAGTQRYPSTKWIDNLGSIDELFDRKKVKFSSHICGSICEDFLQGDRKILKLIQTNVFTRFQLNFNIEKYSVNIFDFIHLMIRAEEKSYNGLNVILQYNQPNKAFMDFLIKYQPGEFLHYLYDSSGGNGKTPDSWPAPLSKPTGYAGGLNLENLDSEIQKILSVTGETPIWIDAESGIRTNNEFDLVKVEKFLEIASKYVEK